MTSTAPEYSISINSGFEVWCMYSRRYTKPSLVKQHVKPPLSFLVFSIRSDLTPCSGLLLRAKGFTSTLTRAQRFSTVLVYRGCRNSEKTYVLTKIRFQFNDMNNLKIETETDCRAKQSPDMKTCFRTRNSNSLSLAKG